VVFRELIFVTIQEIPIQGCKWTGIVTNSLLWVIVTPLAVLGHSGNVCPTCCIGLAHKSSPIGMDSHADDVWNHYPIRSVNELLTHPIQKLLRVGAGPWSFFRFRPVTQGLS
jgi:hypothetical protein